MIAEIFTLFADPPQPRSPMDFQVKDVRANAPEFKRKYTGEIRGIAVKVTARNSFLGHRVVDGELTQSGGRWVFFDPENVAEKIIDRELAPLVQQFCDQVIAADDNFRASTPRYFTDENGNVWERKP